MREHGIETAQKTFQSYSNESKVLALCCCLHLNSELQVHWTGYEYPFENNKLVVARACSQGCDGNGTFFLNRPSNWTRVLYSSIFEAVQFPPSKKTGLANSVNERYTTREHSNRRHVYFLIITTPTHLRPQGQPFWCGQKHSSEDQPCAYEANASPDMCAPSLPAFEPTCSCRVIGSNLFGFFFFCRSIANLTLFYSPASMVYLSTCSTWCGV